MAVRKIVKYGDKSLREPSKEVHKVSKKIQTLIQDLLETMYNANGVGLAAPQVGEHYRIFVIDVSDPKEGFNPIVFVNPKILKKSGAISSNEGCLSFPEAYTNVRRYKNVTIKAQDKNGRSFVMEAKNGTLLARAIQHEFDHLDGVLFIDHCRNRFEAEQVLEEKGLASIDEKYLLNETFLEDQIQKDLEESIDD